VASVTIGDVYRELASWFHVLTPPAEYADEAASALRLLRDAADGPIATLLELGSGGGNMASHLKRDVTLTLTDRSRDMLDVSLRINPEVDHLVGDMRTLRLDRAFDAVLAHDAICYMTTEADLRAAMTTALVHLRPGGAALFEPDYVRETFRTGTDHGGEDGSDGRALRYLEWVTDPDPDDDTYEVDYAVLRRHPEGRVDVDHDHHVEGLFGRQQWLDWLHDVGFVDATSHVDEEDRVVFTARRPR
jgi:trans-aconitate methyltransferase